MLKLRTWREKKRPHNPNNLISNDGKRSGSGGFRFNFFELGGAVGDLGTLLPLSIALISLNRMDPTSVFLVVGLTYILVGLFYQLPVPVQPLKAVSAIAIAMGLSASVVSASGLLMAVILLGLAVAGIMGPMARLFPKAIVRGIQLGLALILLKAGISLISRQQIVAGGGNVVINLAGVSLSMGWFLAVFMAVVFVLLLRNGRFPASLAVLGAGAVIGLFWGSLPGLRDVKMGLSFPTLAVPSFSDLSTAFILLVIPQIPLTLGNAVFAAADTAKTYYGANAQRVSHRNLLTTMGIGNALAGFLGGVPVCHGSGGFTAHFRLGARTGAAPLAIGGMLLVLAIFVDGNVLPILALIPYSTLGVLVAFVGIQHGLFIRDLKNIPEIVVALCVAVIAFVTTNLAIGFGTGMLIYGLIRLLSRGNRGPLSFGILRTRKNSVSVVPSPPAAVVGTVRTEP